MRTTILKEYIFNKICLTFLKRFIQIESLPFGVNESPRISTRNNIMLWNMKVMHMMQIMVKAKHIEL